MAQRPLVAQNDRWYPVASDTAVSASSHPSPLRTWQVVLPLRRGIALWAHNETADSIAVPSVEVRDCVNIDTGCGRTLTDAILAPGDSLLLVTVRPRQWNAKYRFRWTHDWLPVGEAPAADSYVVPAWATRRLDAAAFVEHYVEADYLEPRVLTPDLDGDGREDLAVAIQARDGSRGIALMLATSPGFLVIGADQGRSNGLDLTQVKSWAMHDGVLELVLEQGGHLTVRCEGACATGADAQLRAP